MIRLKNSSALLKQYNPTFVEKLLGEYPEKKDIILGRDLWGDNGGEKRPSEIDGSLTYEVEVKMATEGLAQVKERISPNFIILKKRYVRSKNLKLGAAIISTVTSIGLINFSLGTPNKVLLVISSVLNLLSSFFLLFANNLDAPSINGTRNLATIFESLNGIFAEAEKAELQILKMQAAKKLGNEILPLLEKAENLVIDLRKIERELLTA